MYFGCFSFNGYVRNAIVLEGWKISGNFKSHFISEYFGKYFLNISRYFRQSSDTILCSTLCIRFSIEIPEIFKIFENFHDFWKFSWLLEIFKTFGNFRDFWKFSRLLKIFMTFGNFHDFWKFSRPFREFWKFPWIFVEIFSKKTSISVNFPLL